MNPENRSRLWREASAKTSWGETTAQLCSFLVSRGIPAEEVQGWLAALRRQRVGQVRAIGRNRLLGGIGLAVVFFLWWPPETFSGRTGGGMVICGAFGLYLLADGVLKILFPGMWKGCLRGMDTPPD